VVAGEPVLHLDDEEARVRVATARAQIAMRERVRNDQSAGKGENRRNAEDDVADAEETLINARAAFDVAALAKRDGSGSDAAVATAHAAWMRAQENIDRQRARLRKLESESGTPLPTQKEGDLQVARSELELAVAQLEKLTIRSPIAGTVLQVNVKAGEVAAPTASQPLILLGDVSRLRVRAELDEHDVGKVAAGGSVVVRANAFRGREFAGKVSAIAPIVRLGRISSPASGHLTDFSVNEILIELDDPGPLLVGMKVDVYFRAPK
jgi:HlyD family secretion protein